MYKLVEYLEDGILYICHSSNIRRNKQKIFAKYLNGYFYVCQIICSNANRFMLEEMIKNLRFGIPRILLQASNNINGREKKYLSGEFSGAKISTEADVSSPEVDMRLNEGSSMNTNFQDPIQLEVVSSNNCIIPLIPNTSSAEDNSEDADQPLSINDIEFNQWYDCVIESDNLTSSEKDPELKKRTLHKKHCCYFCKKNVFQISRHLLSIHNKEVEIMEIKRLHQSNPLRKIKISALRKKGDFQHNKNSSDHIVIRKSKNPIVEYTPCPSCYGYFNKNSLRHHKRQCEPLNNDRYLQGKSRKLILSIHERASDKMRNSIVPFMFQDEITNNFIFDEILVVYGNFLCIKYSEEHLISHVRAQLRLLGRLMIRIKLHDKDIKCFKDAVHPAHIDTIRQAIDDVAGLDEHKQIYQHPYNARTLNTEFKKLIEVVKSESDKFGDDELMKLAKATKRRHRHELAPYINRICKISENYQKRINDQHFKLPDNEEVQKYLDYLYCKIKFHEEMLMNKFSLEHWSKLSQYSLVALIVFNRKRPGETQRIVLQDFENRRGLQEKELRDLDKNEKLQAHKYERIGFRGKLGNSTALLIDKVKMLPAIISVIKYRKEAGVHPNNTHLFAIPNSINKTFDAYLSHKQFREECGLQLSSLNFTILRKHLATSVAKGALGQEEELRISNYMSHDYNIHKKVYDQSAAIADITKVSKHLEASAQSKLLPQQSIINHSHLSSSEEQDTIYETADRNEKDCSWEADSDYSFDGKAELCVGKYTSRKLWNSVEKDTTRSYFKKILTLDKKIESPVVKVFREKYFEIMKNRSVPMIKQWLEMEKKKIQQNANGFHGMRPRYSTPERDTLLRCTKKHSSEGSEPSFQEFEEIIEKNETLRRRSVHSLKKKFRELEKRRGLQMK